jgi:type IV secretory pathway VirB2 component (pilin)
MKKRKPRLAVPKKRRQENALPQIKNPLSSISEKTQKYIFSGLCFLLAITILFSFTSSAGVVGANLEHILKLMIGSVVFIAPVLFIIIGIVILQDEESLKDVRSSLIIAGIVFLIGTTGIFGLFEVKGSEILKQNFIWDHAGPGGWIGYIISWVLFKGFLVC